ncbi:MAG: carboxypeptidase regulatory-like domain-containing protein [Planctomycetes bacterium]|nr:carboxypeptidase regulatory-like domain-containing protein [Planctomycetota bacterium]MCP4771376.1 carboxypeptidase regulatory-like domain-containing protein [Planctomycetota bacterium]MCP4861813.1 carboxypeptidase regulatory-like domain-containing protein [Planctomycetota bacterium]
MKRFLPIVLIALFVIAVVWILNSGDKNEVQPDTPNTTPAVAEMEEATLEGGMERTNTVIEEEVFDPRGLKVGAGKYGLHGTVVDEQGTPLGGLWVAAYSVSLPLMDFEFSPEEIFERPLDLNLEPLASTMANEDGTFQLEGVPGRSLFLVARGKHHLTRGRQAVQAEEVGSEKGVLLHTVPGAVLNGHVVDEMGGPVANAEVFVGPSYLYVIQAVRNRDIYLERIFTDAAGNFSIDSVPANARLTIAALDGATHPGMQDVGPFLPGSTVEATVRLVETGTLSGRTVDSDGEGMGGVKIVAIPLDLRMVVGFVRNLPDWMTESSADGSFEFPQLPRRTTVLLAQGRDGRSAPYTARVAGKTNEMNEDITVETTHQVSGRVVSMDGRGVANAKVFLGSIPSKADDSQDIQGGRGMIPSGENLLIGAAREILPELLPSETWAYTDAGGKFTIPAWNSAKLKVEAPGYSDSYFDLPGDLEEDKKLALILLKPGSVSGTVVDGKTKMPIKMFGVSTNLQASKLDPEIDLEMEEDEDWRQFRERHRIAEGKARSEVMDGILKDDEVSVLPAGSMMNNLKNVAINDDGSGKFQIDGLMPGTWRLETRAGGYVLERTHDIVVEAEKVTEGVNIELSKGATLTGQVVAYGTREPVSGAVVTIGWSKESGLSSYFSMGLESMAFARSDKDGMFSLSGIEPGMEWVHVVAEGFSPTAIKGKPLEDDEVREDVIIQVRQGATIQGYVYDRHNQILAGRMVGGYSMDSQDFWQTSTNEDGFYQAEHVKPGNYFIVTAALDADKLFQGDFMSVLNGSKLVNAFAREGETLNIDITDMSANGCKFRGKLLSGGQPIANSALIMMATDGASMFDMRLATAQSNAEGEFEFPSLAPGSYRMQLESEIWRGAIEVEVPDADEDYQVLNTPMGKVYGRIVEELTGEPVSGATVKLVRNDSSGGMFAMFTGGKETDFEQSDESGNFEFEGKSPGRYHIEVEMNEWGSVALDGGSDSGGGASLGKASVKTFELSRDASYPVGDIRLPIASAIRVHITTSNGKQPDRGYNLVAKRVDGDDDGGKEDTETWGWGESSLISGLNPGTYDITISGRGYITTRLEGVYVPQAETVDIDAVLEEGLPLNARILDPNNQPIAGAYVQVLDGAGNRVDGLSGTGARMSRMFASEDGTMPLGSFAPGSYTVRVEWDGQVKTQTASLAGTEVTVVEFQF